MDKIITPAYASVRALIYIDETDYKKIPGLLSALDTDRQCREFIENA